MFVHDIAIVEQFAAQRFCTGHVRWCSDNSFASRQEVVNVIVLSGCMFETIVAVAASAAGVAAESLAEGGRG